MVYHIKIVEIATVSAVFLLIFWSIFTLPKSHITPVCHPFSWQNSGKIAKTAFLPIKKEAISDLLILVI